MENRRKNSPWDLSIQQQMPHSQKSFQAHNGLPTSPLTRLLITWHTIAWCPPTLVGTRHCKVPTPTVLTRNPSTKHRFLHVGKYSSRHALIPATTIGTFGTLEAPNSNSVSNPIPPPILCPKVGSCVLGPNEYEWSKWIQIFLFQKPGHNEYEWTCPKNRNRSWIFEC